MKNDYLFRYYATLGPIGYLPASGTFATFVTLIILSLMPYTTSWNYPFFLVITYCCFYYFVKKILIYYAEDDPSQIVVDEVIGCLVTFYAVPVSWLSLCFGFLLFRFFDISKIGPVGWFERIKGASGIMLDDVAAGVLSNIILRSLWSLYA